MNMYILPALVALFVKLGILIVAHRSDTHSKFFYKVVLAFALHNLCEVLLFLKFFIIGNYEPVLLSYYVMSVWGLVFILLYGMEVARANIRFIGNALLALGVTLTALLLATDLIVAGAHSFSYTMTAIRGPFYWVFQVFSILMYFAVSLVLIQGYRNAKGHNMEIRCLSTLVAFAPIVLLSVGIIIVMNLGYQFNATAILPVATSAFLVITLLGESQHKLTDIRRFLPWSPERKTSNEIMDIFSQYARDDVNYREAVSDIERLLVLHKYQKNDANASATAELMGMPRSSLYSIFNRLKIDSRG
ncbi:MAG: hypothetical protein JKX81_07750 [Arenicella sp.]|nr:hypothetical protein [Arenicella sp.]